MNRVLASVAVTSWIACGLAGGSLAREPKTSMSLSGVWNCQSAIIDGRPLAPEAARQLQLTMTADRFKTERAGQVLFDSTYTVDSTQNPPQINMVGTEGELKGKPALGIYELEANQLTLCYVMPGSPRPTALESKPQSGAFLIVWKRAEQP